MPVPTFPLDSGDIIELMWISAYQSSVVLNVWHFRYTDTPQYAQGAEALRELATEQLQSYWADPIHGMKSRITIGFQVQYVRAQVVHPVRKPYVQLPFLNQNGTAGNPGIPSDTQLTIDLRPLAVGRGRVGNKKITGLPTSVVTGDVFSAAELVQWQVIAANMLEDLIMPVSTLTFEPVIWNARTPARHDRLFNYRIREEVRVLRRRQKGIGI